MGTWESSGSHNQAVRVRRAVMGHSGPLDPIVHGFAGTVDSKKTGAGLSCLGHTEPHGGPTQARKGIWLSPKDTNQGKSHFTSARLCSW